MWQKVEQHGVYPGALNIVQYLWDLIAIKLEIMDTVNHRLSAAMLIGIIRVSMVLIWLTVLFSKISKSTVTFCYIQGFDTDDEKTLCQYNLNHNETVHISSCFQQFKHQRTDLPQKERENHDIKS